MIKFELSEQMVQIIAEVLGNAPYKVAAPVLAEMQKQINEQQPKPVSPPPNGSDREILLGS